MSRPHAPAAAGAAFDAAFARARDSGLAAPIRDVVVPYVAFRLRRGETAAAQELVALVAAHADTDFDCAQAAFEVSRRVGDALAAQRFAKLATHLAGERRLRPIDETMRSDAPAQAPAAHP